MSQQSSTAAAPSGRSHRSILIAVAVLVVALVSVLALPHAGVEAASLTSGGWTTNGTSTTKQRGTTATVSVTVRSSTTRRGLVDLEIYSSASAKVFQQSWDNQSFTAGVTRTFTANWAIPANQAVGTYTIKAGMFGPGWNSLQHWNGSAGTVAVTS